MSHTVPFQCSARVLNIVLLEASPIPQTSLAATRAMAFRGLELVVALGVATTFHFVPFQFSASVLKKVGPLEPPTDQTLVGVAAATVS